MANNGVVVWCEACGADLAGELTLPPPDRAAFLAQPCPSCPALVVTCTRCGPLPPNLQHTAR